MREYRDLLTRRDSARVYASQQRARVEGQRDELASIEDQLTRVDDIVEQATPMMMDMIADLEMFINADVPFKVEDRLEVVQRLRDLMGSAKVSDAERYRQIIKAYEDELEYGRTVQTWSAPVQQDGAEIEYDYFLYGRVAFMRMNEVARKGQRWSRSQNAWVDLPSSALKDVKKSILIADKKSPPAVMMAIVEKFSVSR